MDTQSRKKAKDGKPRQVELLIISFSIIQGLMNLKNWKIIGSHMKMVLKNGRIKVKIGLMNSQMNYKKKEMIYLMKVLQIGIKEISLNLLICASFMEEPILKCSRILFLVEKLSMKLKNTQLFSGKNMIKSKTMENILSGQKEEKKKSPSDKASIKLLQINSNN